jgi:hypothetical protein
VAGWDEPTRKEGKIGGEWGSSCGSSRRSGVSRVIEVSSPT